MTIHEEGPESATEPTVPNGGPSDPATRPVGWVALGLVAGIGLAVIAFAIWRSGEPSRRELVAE